MSFAGVIIRHQAGAILATTVDFLAMVFWVELLRGSPITGTVVGASCGAVRPESKADDDFFPRDG